MNRKQVAYRSLVAILSVGLLFLAGVTTLSAQSGGRDVNAIIEEILEDQGVSSIENVNPDRVDSDLLQELGEAVTSERAWQEDSSRVGEANRWMGYRFLQSGGDFRRFGGGPGMMGPGMMGFGRNGAWGNGSWAGPDRGPWGRSVWNNYGQSRAWLPPWAWVLLALLLVAVVVLLILVFTRRREPTKREGDAMDILRSRYARGEISREEFQSIREELR